jgi:two-component system alkaline phosphatase synthesis response regulator PhoP
MAEKYSLLLVEDEVNLHDTLKLNLELEGYEVTSAKTGTAALQKAEREYFDLIIMDIMLPELDGISIIENIRIRNNDVPILILSARNASSDRILGLQKGADDYLTKPFNIEELLLRIQKLIEKHQKLHEKDTVGDLFEFGHHKIDFVGQKAMTKSGQQIPLSKKEIMLLKLFINNKNKVVTREKILQTVWGYHVYPTTRTIDNFILNFRKYFEEDSRHPRYFHSIRGVGYKFTD